ncbi:hypothetical protein ACA910_022534 [Epithemia clementina (nom. ined.)]
MRTGTNKTRVAVLSQTNNCFELVVPDNLATANSTTRLTNNTSETADAVTSTTDTAEEQASSSPLRSRIKDSIINPSNWKKKNNNKIISVLSKADNCFELEPQDSAITRATNAPSFLSLSSHDNHTARTTNTRQINATAGHYSFVQQRLELPYSSSSSSSIQARLRRMHGAQKTEEEEEEEEEEEDTSIEDSVGSVGYEGQIKYPATSAFFSDSNPEARDDDDNDMDFRRFAAQQVQVAPPPLIADLPPAIANIPSHGSMVSSGAEGGQSSSSHSRRSHRSTSSSSCASHQGNDHNQKRAAELPPRDKQHLNRGILGSLSRSRGSNGSPISSPTILSSKKLLRRLAPLVQKAVKAAVDDPHERGDKQGKKKTHKPSDGDDKDDDDDDSAFLLETASTASTVTKSRRTPSPYPPPPSAITVADAMAKDKEEEDEDLDELFRILGEQEADQLFGTKNKCTSNTVAAAVGTNTTTTTATQLPSPSPNHDDQELNHSDLHNEEEEVHDNIYYYDDDDDDDEKLLLDEAAQAILCVAETSSEDNSYGDDSNNKNNNPQTNMNDYTFFGAEDLARLSQSASEGSHQSTEKCPSPPPTGTQSSPPSSAPATPSSAPPSPLTDDQSIIVTGITEGNQENAENREQPQEVEKAPSSSRSWWTPSPLPLAIPNMRSKTTDENQDSDQSSRGNQENSNAAKTESEQASNTDREASSSPTWVQALQKLVDPHKQSFGSATTQPRTSQGSDHSRTNSQIKEDQQQAKESSGNPEATGKAENIFPDRQSSQSSERITRMTLVPWPSAPKDQENQSSKDDHANETSSSSPQEAHVAEAMSTTISSMHAPAGETTTAFSETTTDTQTMGPDAVLRGRARHLLRTRSLGRFFRATRHGSNAATPVSKGQSADTASAAEPAPFPVKEPNVVAGDDESTIIEVEYDDPQSLAVVQASTAALWGLPYLRSRSTSTSSSSSSSSSNSKVNNNNYSPVRWRRVPSTTPIPEGEDEDKESSDGTDESTSNETGPEIEENEHGSQHKRTQNEIFAASSVATVAELNDDIQQKGKEEHSVFTAEIPPVVNWSKKQPNSSMGNKNKPHGGGEVNTSYPESLAQNMSMLIGEIKTNKSSWNSNKSENSDDDDSSSCNSNSGSSARQRMERAHSPDSSETPVRRRPPNFGNLLCGEESPALSARNGAAVATSRTMTTRRKLVQQPSLFTSAPSVDASVDHTKLCGCMGSLLPDSMMLARSPFVSFQGDDDNNKYEDELSYTSSAFVSQGVPFTLDEDEEPLLSYASTSYTFYSFAVASGDD